MQTDAAEQQEQIAALRDFAATSLAELERLLAGDKQAQIAALERFATASDLKTLRDLAEEQRTEFDAIDFLRLANDEEFHSNFLAWLLGPNNNHGIGDYFLKKFLRRVGLSSESIESVDWTPAESQREWPNEVDGQPGSLDILILNESTGFLCAIENKIWSGEHSEQLTRYRKALEERYPDYDRHYIFLSPRGTLPYRKVEQEYWKPMNYTTILELVEQTIDDTEVREDVRAFLRQYATTLRRKIVPDSNTNIAELAREIYLKHREAIELIYRNKPDYASEIKQIFKEAISRQASWKLDKEETSWVRFRPSSWANSGVMETGTQWRPQSNALILCQLYCTANNAHLYLTLGSGSNRLIREKIINSVNQNPSVFNSTGPALIDGWMTFHRQERILDDADLANWDDCDAVGPAKLRAWVADFAQKKFPAMNDVIVRCLKEYEADQVDSGSSPE